MRCAGASNPLSVVRDTILRVTTALLYLVVMALVAAVVFLLVAVVFGRGEQLPPLPPGASPTRLPESGVTGADLIAVRFQLVLRGYKMSEVDWVLRRTGAELEALLPEATEPAEPAEPTEPTGPAEPAERVEADEIEEIEPGWVRP